MAASLQPQCAICYDELTERLTAAPCGHVFHTECITPWHGAGGNCPMCMTSMPRKLLRLFYEPRQAPEGDVKRTTTGNPTSMPEAGAGGEAGTAEKGAPAVSAEVTGLRRELASTRMVIEVNKEAVAKHDSAMQELRANLIRVKAAAASTKAEQEDTIKATEAKLQTTSIELCRKHTEVNRLKREMEGIHDRLRKLQGDKVAHEYLKQFAVQSGEAVPAAASRSLNGLGQVNVETVLEQVKKGGVSASSIIRSQHDFLSGGMDREQKAKRKLRESKLEGETTALQLEKVQAKLARAAKELYSLRKALSQPKRNQGGGGPPENAQGAAGAPKTERGLGAAPKLSGRSPLLGRTDGQKDKEGGGRSREASRTPVGTILHRADGGKKRPRPAGGVGFGMRGIGGALGVVRGDPSVKRPSAAVRYEEDEGMVSLGSDGGESDSDAENKGGKNQQERRAELCTLPTNSRGILAPAITPRSFFAGAASRGQAKGQPAQFIGRGYNATGGRHNVRKSAANQPSLAGK